MIRPIAIALAVVAAAPTLGAAGPPYLTDDLQPTDTGHWEIYDFVVGAQDQGGLVEVYTQTQAGHGEPGYRAVDLGATYRLTRHWSFLASAGPSFELHDAVGEVFYASLKADHQAQF